MGGCWIKYQLFKQELALRTKAAGRQGTNTGKGCSPPTQWVGNWPSSSSVGTWDWNSYASGHGESHRFLGLKIKPSPGSLRRVTHFIRRLICSKEMILFTISYSYSASFEHRKGFLFELLFLQRGEVRKQESKELTFAETYYMLVAAGHGDTICLSSCDSNV